jgi:hypothetical protein
MKPDQFDEDTCQELRRAIENDDVERVTRLLAKAPELLHVADPDSCLHIAAWEGHLKIVELLVNLGVDINLEVELYATPLDNAACNGHLEVVQYLVNKGASLAVPCPDVNPLFSAIYGGHVDIARFLLEAGLDPHVIYRSESGRLKNALSFARQEEKPGIVELLLQTGCRLPIEGVDKPVWHPEKFHEVTAADRTHDQIISRMATVFGTVDPLSLQEIVPVHDDAHVAVNVICPNPQHPFLTLFTTGMSDRAMTVPPGQEAYQYAELVMHLPATWPHPRNGDSADAMWPLEWLRKVAYYPHLHGTWLGGPTTIISSDDPPVPLGANTQQTCLLLIADFADWSPMGLDDGRSVCFYTVVPLYTEERDFEKQHGIVPLLQRLRDRNCTTVVNVNRANVACDDAASDTHGVL